MVGWWHIAVEELLAGEEMRETGWSLMRRKAWRRIRMSDEGGAVDG